MIIDKGVKMLLENPDFFLTFEDFTEPLEQGFVESNFHLIKSPADVFKIIGQLKRVQVSSNYIWTVKFMETHKVIGGCTEYALMSAALLRKAGFPTAILDLIDIAGLFNRGDYDPIRPPLSMHVVNLVYYKNRWWMLDSASQTFTRYISLPIISKRYLPVFIHRGYSDLGIKSRKERFIRMVEYIRNILPLDLEWDLVYQKIWDYLS